MDDSCPTCGEDANGVCEYCGADFRARGFLATMEYFPAVIHEGEQGGDSPGQYLSYARKREQISKAQGHGRTGRMCQDLYSLESNFREVQRLADLGII